MPIKITKKQIATFVILASLGTGAVVIDNLKKIDDPVAIEEAIDTEALFRAQAKYARWKLTELPEDALESAQWQLLYDVWNKQIDKNEPSGKITLNGLDNVQYKMYLKVDEWNQK